MGQDDKILASVAHVVLGCVAGRGISRIQSRCWTDPGMHANFFIHGVVGFLHYQSAKLKTEVSQLYNISTMATKYLALPCVMADLYHNDKQLSTLHLASGIIPFALAIAGSENKELGNLCVALNIVSLAYWSHQHSKEYGWYTAGAAVFAYFLAPAAPEKALYPLGLAIMEYCAYRLYLISFE